MAPGNNVSAGGMGSGREGAVAPQTWSSDACQSKKSGFRGETTPSGMTWKCGSGIL